MGFVSGSDASSSRSRYSLPRLLTIITIAIPPFLFTFRGLPPLSTISNHSSFQICCSTTRRRSVYHDVFPCPLYYCIISHKDMQYVFCGDTRFQWFVGCALSRYGRTPRRIWQQVGSRYRRPIYPPFHTFLATPRAAVSLAKSRAVGSSFTHPPRLRQGVDRWMPKCRVTQSGSRLHKQLDFRLPPPMPVPWEALIPFGTNSRSP